MSDDTSTDVEEFEDEGESEIVVKNDDGSTTIQLARSFKHAKQAIDEVRLRDVYARDLRAMDQVSGEVSKRLRLVSQLSGLSISAVDKIHASDLAVITEVLDECLEKSPSTGGTS